MSFRTSAVVTCAALLSFAGATLGAQTPPPVAEQITAAVQALPKELRDGAGVMGYKSAGKLEWLRPTKNGMMCLADDPAEEQFHVSCYHDSMDPFMARGRALRDSGVKGAQVDTVRFAEVKAGKIKMPTAPSSLYQSVGHGEAGEPAVRGVHPVRHHGHHWHLDHTVGHQAVADVSRHAEGAHHVLVDDVIQR
jgi:hypothetical protein